MMPEVRMIEKASAGERFNHLVMLVSFFVLAITGLGFLFVSLDWMNVIFGGNALAKEIHKWAGVVFGVSVLISIGNYLGESLSWSSEDSEWLSGLGGYFSGAKMPEQGRMNAGQKIFYLVVFITGILFIVSGFMLWIGTAQGMLRWGLLLHNIANVIVLTTVPLHLYLATICNPGTARIMGSGKVPVDWAKKRHAKWIRSLGIE